MSDETQALTPPASSPEERLENVQAEYLRQVEQGAEGTPWFLGEKFSLKKFHAYAFRQGPMGLDPFKAEIAKWDGN